MTGASELGRYLEKSIAARLGGRLGSGGAIWVPVAEGYDGFIGLNRETDPRHKGWLGINPVVGGRHVLVADVETRLLDEAPGVRAPTWSATLYDLDRAVPFQWAFEAPIHEEAVEALAETLSDPGMRLIEQSSSLGAIRDHLVRGHGYHVQTKLPVVLALLGDWDAALDFARTQLFDGPPAGPWRDHYAAFIGRLEQWIEHDRRIDRAVGP